MIFISSDALNNVPTKLNSFSPCKKCQRAKDPIMPKNRGISSNFRSPRNSFAETEAEDGAA
ncbi:unnamed protein product, partial [Nesidiocoris tenuis]